MTGTGETAAEQMRSAVRRAAPFIDAGPRSASGWRASDLIAMGFYMIETGRAGEPGAAQFANDMLDEARNRYAAGFYADPFMEPAQPRPRSEMIDE